MSEFKGYSFNVQIWEEDGVYNYAVVQEFEGPDEFEPLGFGTADSFEEAVRLAGEEIRPAFNV